MSSRIERPAQALGAGTLAGLAGGVAVGLFLAAVTVASGKSLAENYEFIASVLVGRTALSNPAFIPLGIVLHFLVSVGWALGYVYLVRTTPQLVTRPIVSGLAFGLIVYFAMQVVLVGAGAYQTPTPASLLAGLGGDCVFYGVPVALIVSRFARRG